MLFIDYLPAELRNCKSRWYVEYSAKNPKTGKLHRKQIRINRVRNLTERKKYGRKLVREVNKKLESGWNPFLEQEAPRAFTKLTDALDVFMNAKIRDSSNKDSLRTYQSHVDRLQNYINNIIKKPDLLVISFDNYEAKMYFDYLYNDREIGGRTFNNYKSFAVLMWNWFIENMYCKSNPFVTIKKKNVTKKKRTIIDKETRTKLKNHLLANKEYEYLAMVMLCFHGLLRPKEICQLKPENVNFEKKIIFLTPEITKDKDERIVTLNNEVMEALNRLNISEIPQHHFIFSAGYTHGTKQIGSKEIGRRWLKLRKELNMKPEFMFYSLKDSGIVQMLQDGVNPLDVRNQAGHSSLEQTNEYAKYANPKGSQQIKDKDIKF